MPQLDRLLSVLSSNHGESLRIAQDEPAHLMRGGSAHPVTKQPLSGDALLALLREVAPPDASQRLQSGSDAQFEYAYGNDIFVASATFAAGRLSASVMPKATAGSGNGHTAPARAGAANGATVVPATDDAEGRAALEALLKEQVRCRASDLHLRSGDRPSIRVDGDIVALQNEGPMEGSRLERLLHAVMPERNRREFAETNDTDFAHELAELGRFRVNVFRDRRGVGAVMRAIPSRVVTAEELGLSPEIQALCRLNKGLVLVTGPTGSGKSTTLCALIDLVNRTRHDHIVTIEDPIEFVHESKGCLITQRQVGVHTTSFKQALRAALREDPDVVLVGELRDLETVSIAIETAETGHLVFGTLHTSTAASTIDRVIDQFPSDRQDQIRVMLSESLKGVISQTLCRKVGGGRVAAMEVLLATPAMSNLIREAKTFQIPSVMQTSRRLGMVTLNDALLELAEGGKIEPKEAYAKALDKSAIAQSLKSRGFDVSFVEPDAATEKSSGVRHDSGMGSGIGAKTPMPRPGYKR
jgi:twitching motility protein PilT